MSERPPPYITGNVYHHPFRLPEMPGTGPEPAPPYGAPREPVPPPTEEQLVASGKVVRLPRESQHRVR